MATLISTIKSWFLTGLKPTQQQFWDTFESFRHKLDPIPIADVAGINDLFVDINNHFNDPNAHELLLTQVQIYQFGNFQLFKAKTNFEAFLEVGDVANGWLADETTFIPFGRYLGGDPQDIASWEVSQINF